MFIANFSSIRPWSPSTDWLTVTVGLTKSKYHFCYHLATCTVKSRFSTKSDRNRGSRKNRFSYVEINYVGQLLIGTRCSPSMFLLKKKKENREASICKGINDGISTTVVKVSPDLRWIVLKINHSWNVRRFIARWAEFFGFKIKNLYFQCSQNGLVMF